MSRKMIPVEEVFAEWLKEPEYVNAYDALEDEFPMGGKGPLRPRSRGADPVGITGVLTLMGCYTSVSMTLAFYDVPAGAAGPAC